MHLGQKSAVEGEKPSKTKWTAFRMPILAVLFPKRPPRPEERNSERHTRACPGHRVSHTGTQIAPDFAEENGGPGTHEKFHNAGYRGHHALPQPLQGIAEDKEQRQYPVVKAVDNEVHMPHLHDFLLAFAHEQLHDKGAGAILSG